MRDIFPGVGKGYITAECFIFVGPASGGYSNRDLSSCCLVVTQLANLYKMFPSPGKRKSNNRMIYLFFIQALNLEVEEECRLTAYSLLFVSGTTNSAPSDKGVPYLV